jgi:hypothetical protein
MRTAFAGRAAAYLAKRDYEKALRDQDVVILFYAIEIDVKNDLAAPGRDKLMEEAARAHRVRADMFLAAGKIDRAESDLIRAEKLDSEAAKLSAAATSDK